MLLGSALHISREAVTVCRVVMAAHIAAYIAVAVAV